MKIETRPYPHGGHTVAVPISGTFSARIYVGQHDSAKSAEAAARALAAPPVPPKQTTLKLYL